MNQDSEGFARLTPTLLLRRRVRQMYADEYAEKFVIPRQSLLLYDVPGQAQNVSPST